MRWVTITILISITTTIASIDRAIASTLEENDYSSIELPIVHGRVRFYEDQDYAVNYAIERNDGSIVRSKLKIIGTDNIITEGSKLTRSLECEENTSCIEFKNGLGRVKVESDSISRTSSVFINITGVDTSSVLSHCIDLGEDRWFAGPEAKYQEWPIENAVWNYTEYLPKEDDAFAIAEGYWLSSSGISVYVSPRTPLFIDQNSAEPGYLCLYAQSATPYANREFVSLELNLTLSDDPRTAHELHASKVFANPTDIPDERMIRQPLWSSWARYKVNVSESRVRQYAQEILDNGFNHSQIEIDDFWETCYGSLTFSTSDNKFPDIKNLTDDLHALGFRVTLWIHPFVNADCTEYYEEALRNGYLAKDVNGSVHTIWWQGGYNSSIIDFTNSDAVEWFTSRLWALKNSSGIDSFKFDAGETSWLPEPANLTGDWQMLPGLYTNVYSRTVAEFGTGIEVRSGWLTQDLPIFVRMLDKDTNWGFDNGLPTLVTTLLVMNMAGYGFVLPDMVGGNGYLDGSLNGTVYPEKELFIRWLQANTFMPSIQYSFVPWDYDNETIEICRTFTELHENYAPTIIEVMRTAVSSMAPVNPPIWWVDPTNSEAHGINDEYLLGESILVAPVLVEGAVTRDIYLPSGTWREEAYETRTIYEGPVWITDYPAPLDILPYFTKIDETNETENGGYSRTSSIFFVSTMTVLALLAGFLRR